MSEKINCKKERTYTLVKMWVLKMEEKNTNHRENKLQKRKNTYISKNVSCEKMWALKMKKKQWYNVLDRWRVKNGSDEKWGEYDNHKNGVERWRVRIGFRWKTVNV